MRDALPNSDSVNTAVLAALFEDTSTSYKFLFFLALLEALRSRPVDDPAAAISLSELAVRMMVLAWYPARLFHLSFGIQDQIHQEIEALRLPIDETVFSFDAGGRARLRAAVAERLNPRGLVRYVPFRLIRVFFGQELSGMPDQQLRRELIASARARFDRVKPLYCFDKDVGAIHLHPQWVAYLRRNMHIVQSWASWEWLQYMQRKNSSVPGLASKLFPPDQRQALTTETKLWKLVGQQVPLKCLYSGDKIDRFSLDHFLPWTFVVHNELWNLIPTSPEANSAKSRRLPDPRYLDGFICAQVDALRVWQKKLPTLRWQKLAATYVDGLRLESMATLEDRTKVRLAYETVYTPMLELAANQGFASGWVFSRR